MSLTQEDFLSALKQRYDPEIPVNIVDLGLIYGIHFESAPGDQQASRNPPWTPECLSPDARKQLGIE